VTDWRLDLLVGPATGDMEITNGAPLAMAASMEFDGDAAGDVLVLEDMVPSGIKGDVDGRVWEDGGGSDGSEIEETTVGGGRGLATELPTESTCNELAGALGDADVRLQK
jgi:hypothetical protein